MRSELACAAVLLAVAAGCKRYPDTYAPPEQRRPFTIEEPPVVKSFLAMNDPVAPLQFVKDIDSGLEAGTSRWTLKQPTVRLSAPKEHGLRFVADVTVPEQAFRLTGPVAITVTINDRKLDTFAFDKPGSRRLEKPVPEGWLYKDDDNIVMLEIDKLWTSPAERPPAGFLLHRVGFIE
jgi:hypothetical protein